MAQRSSKLEQLRQAVIGNQRGREVEVEPTGEIKIADKTEGTNQNLSNSNPPKASKMSPHTFGV